MHTMASTCFRLSITMLSIQYFCIGVAVETNLSTDQSALLALKAHITSDPQNILTTNWSTSTTSNICNWVGVTCGVRHLRITALDLSYMGLTGTIPPHIGNLSFLIELLVTNNSFHGRLPQELARLRRLKYLKLANNSLDRAEIPSWLGSFPKLQWLSLCGNQFFRSIPTAIFNLSSLQGLDLQNNQLSGSIPREIGNLTMLKQIYLDSNNFREIPNEIGTLHQMEKFFVESNALKGHVPMAIFNLSSLSILTLYGNNLTGNIPDNICQHLPNIQLLDLGSNLFDGPLPSKLWQCKKLAALGLDYNSFTGRLPKSIGNLTLLTILSLGYNNLTGTIPDEIGGLQNLQFLQLGENNLNGSIPSTLFNMSRIEMIALADNQLSGSFPPIGLGVPKLQQLIVTINHLSGVIPNSISNASKLTLLGLPSNSFTGFIPVTLCDLTNLQKLGLHQNMLTIDTSTPKANILSCLHNLRNLMLVDLGSNPLDATLPVSFGNLSTSFQSLSLSNGNMRGNIPNDIGNLSSLTILALGENQLSGSIPTSIGRLQSLQGLDLAINKLQGHIPYELCELVNLNLLLVGGNRLSGSIPSCLGNLTAALRYLSLDSNFLHSTIPSTLWGLTYILNLGLSINLLTGSLPEDIGNLKVVIALDLSNNHLSGSIPRSIGGLQDLVNLSLSNNELRGPVPSSFGKLLSLELLDLSRNNLSGDIPKTLQALSHLKYLNLSFNKLEGEIPSGGPFNNFPTESFVSNSALCGAARLHIPPCKNSTIQHSRKSSTSNLKYLIPGILLATLLVVCISMMILRRKRNVEVATENSLSPQLLWTRVSRLELRRATNGFNESNLLGTGGFGSVYKATLADGIDVAVKVFNMQLENAFKTFDIECETLRNIRHRNLIKTISCCSEIDFKALVLQYMPNGSLEKWLYSPDCSLSILQRLNIITDVALALEYLHHNYLIPIVHCDVKPSNILLDDNMVAHVSDFGIAKLMDGGDSVTQTVTLATIGYMAPEYGMEGRVSTRGDVYSFGIVVLETFTKTKPTDEMFVGEMNLKQWVTNSLSSDAIAQVMDADLLGTIQQADHDFEAQKDCLSSVMRLALACSAESPEERINMQEAVATLNKIKIKLLKNNVGGL